VLNARVGLNRYLELARADPGLGFNPAELGFSQSLVDQLPTKVFPRFNFFTNTTSASPIAGVEEYRQLGRNNRNKETTTGFSLQPNFSLSKSSHTLRGGLDMRMTWYTRAIDANLFVLNFDRRFTQRVYNSSDAQSGNAIASFLLGAASGGAVDNIFYPTLRWNYYAPWFQDDWHITNRLTMNLGVRWDLNTPVFETKNRLNYGFDMTSTNPVSSRIDQTRFPGYKVLGGLGFVNVGGKPKYPYNFEQHPAARGLCVHAQRPDDHARRVRPLLPECRQYFGVKRIRHLGIADHLA
jgi:hypothetical protein